MLKVLELLEDVYVEMLAELFYLGSKLQCVVLTQIILHHVQVSDLRLAFGVYGGVEQVGEAIVLDKVEADA